MMKDEPWLEARSGLGELESGDNHFIKEALMKSYYKYLLEKSNREKIEIKE